MIRPLYTLKETYRGKKIYIWNINRNSFSVFLKAFVRGIEIQGFITPQERYTNEKYMNRPVLTFEQIKWNRDSIVLVSDDVPYNVISCLPQSIILRWSDSLEVNAELKQSKIIIYGTGNGEDQLCQILSRENMEATLYCVTKRDNLVLHKGKRVIEQAELEKYADYAVIISVQNEQYRKEILYTLSDFRGQVYIEVDHFIHEAVGDLANPVQSIDLAIKKSRKIYLYSKRNAIAKLIESSLNLYGIVVEGYVYDREIEEQNIESIYELAYDGVDDKLIIIYEEFPERLIKVRQNVELAGFSLEKATYTGFQWHTRQKERLLQVQREFHDPLVGGSILYPKGKPGWKVYGREKSDRIRIVVLGGSTSSEEFQYENWISKLYYKLYGQNIKTTIYNGAHAANDIVDEILRLLRDGYELHPHIVISMSGVNNLYYKDSSNQFNEERLIAWCKVLSPNNEYCSGVKSDESAYHFWIRNEKLLGVVAEFLGAKFFSFLQPMNNTMEDMSLREKSLYEQERRINGAREFAQLANDQEGYINLMRLFEHHDEMYFDICHYTDKAHAIIAERVYDSIYPTLLGLSENLKIRQ